MNTHRQLRVWQAARKLVNCVYTLTRALPSEEKYVAVSQMRRAVWSAHNNIAEGNAKLGYKERRRFFDIALGSLAEVDAMAVTLADLYDMEEQLLEDIDGLRANISGGLFAMLRRGRPNGRK